MQKAALKSATREILARAYYATRHYLPRLKGKVLILNYHRILPRDNLPLSAPVQPGMYVFSDAFEDQIRFLSKHFSVLSFTELLERWNDSSLDSEGRYCVITFDDGWIDNYLHAFPILKRYGMPATIFLPTALIGTDRWFWPDKLAYLFQKGFASAGTNDTANVSSFLENRFPWLAPLANGTDGESIDGIIEKCKMQPLEEINEFLETASSSLGIKFPAERVLMHWGEVEAMSREKISFGSHSCTHRILTTLTPREVQQEVEESFQTLRSNCRNAVPVLAYPNGNYNIEVAELVKAAGYRAAASTRFGYEGRSPTELFSLRRVGVHQDLSATTPLFTLHLAGGNQFLKVPSFLAGRTS